MLTTIQDLEREIDQFHKNIKDSNELMRILMSVATITKTQTEAFDTRTHALQDELVKLPSDISSIVQKDIDGFIQIVKTEQQTYQDSISQLMNSYAEKISHAESIISEFPSTIEVQLKKDRIENADSLKNIQEQYAAVLSKANVAFADQLNRVTESIQSLAAQIKADSAQQYAAFLKELEKTMDARLTQLAETEKHVSQLSQQLEVKYSAFVEKLESTNMDQLYKYCQDMNRAINIKLGIVLGGVAVAVIVSIISLFI